MTISANKKLHRYVCLVDSLTESSRRIITRLLLNVVEDSVSGTLKELSVSDLEIASIIIALEEGVQKELIERYSWDSETSTLDFTLL